MEMKIPAIAITAVVVVIVLAGVLMPVLDDATADTDTFTNDGYFYMEKITADDDRTISISWSNATPKQFTINDTVVDVTSWPNTGYTIVTDGISKIIRMGTSTAVALQTMGSSFNSGGSTTATSDITISGGTITVATVGTNSQTSTLTATYTDLWVYSTEPTDYVMKKADKVAYLDDESEYLAMGVTTVTQWNTIIKVDGTVDDFNASIVFPSGVTSTVTDKNIVMTENSNYLGLYELDKLTFTVSDGTNTVDATYSYFIVPAEVTVERAVHFTDNQNAIFAAIPIMVIVALLIAVVALVFRGRQF